MAGYAILHSLVLTLVRYLSHDLSIGTLLFFRNLFASITILPLLYNRLTLFKTSNLSLHLLRAFAAFVGGYATFYALSSIPLSLVVAIAFTAPIFASLYAFSMLNETMTKQRVISLLLGLAGTLIILRPNVSLAPIGIVAAVLASIMTATAFITVKKLSKLDDPITVMAFPFVLLLPISAIVAFVDWTPPSLGQLPILLLIAPGLTLSQYFMVKAFSHAQASHILPVDFVKLIVTSVTGVFLFNEKIDTWIISGGAVILLGAVLSLAKK